MRFFKITKWELKNILSSKKFLMIFVVQFGVLILMMSFFNTFITTLDSDEGVSLSPSLTGFASIDISDNSSYFTDKLNNDVLNIGILNYNNSMKNLNDGKITAILSFPENSQEKIDNFQSIDVDLYVNSEDPKQAVVLKEVNSTLKAFSSSISDQWINSIIPSENIVDPQIKEEKKGESLPLQIIKKMMMALLLFIPLFLFGNIVIDSIVGEKERKTGEILIAMPLNHSDIIIGKNMATILVIALQVGIWILIMLISGFSIKNPILVYIGVVLTSVPIIGVTSVVAAYSKNYKEAGIGLSFIYIIIVGFLIVPALAYISNGSSWSGISPMTLVVRLFSGESILTVDFIIPICSVVIISIISYLISIELFKRDDIVFGPRPGLINLMLDFAGIKKRSYK